MPYRFLRVMLQSRAHGIQLPIAENDVIHFFSMDGVIDGYLSGEFVLYAIQEHITRGKMTEMVRRAQDGEPPRRSLPEPTTDGVELPPDREARAVLRDRRRKPPRKMLMPLGVSYAIMSAAHFDAITDLFWSLYGFLEAIL